MKKGYLKKRVQDSGDYGLELTTQYDYTNWGTVTSVINPRSKTTAYTVNNYDWVTLVNPPGNDQTQYTFDANGNVTQKDVQNVDGAGDVVTANSVWTTTYTYGNRSGESSSAVRLPIRSVCHPLPRWPSRTGSRNSSARTLR